MLHKNTVLWVLFFGYFFISSTEVSLDFEQVKERVCMQCGVTLQLQEIVLAQMLAGKTEPVYLCTKCRESLEKSPWGGNVQSAIEGTVGHQKPPEHGTMSMALSDQQRLDLIQAGRDFRAEVDAQFISQERAERRQPELPQRRRWKLPSWRSVVSFFAFWRRTQEVVEPNFSEPHVTPIQEPQRVQEPRERRNIKLTLDEFGRDPRSLRTHTLEATIDNDFFLTCKGPTATRYNLPGKIKEVQRFPGSWDEVLIVTDQGVFSYTQHGLHVFTSMQTAHEKVLESLPRQDVSSARGEYVDLEALEDAAAQALSTEYLDPRTLTEEEYQELKALQEAWSPPPRPHRPPSLPVRPPHLQSQRVPPSHTYVDDRGVLHTDV